MSAGTSVNPREERLAFAGEILGSPIVVEHAPGVAHLPIDGILVDETLHMLHIRTALDQRIVKIQKTGLTGTIYVEGRELPLRGENLRVRPEDRTKRILSGGRGGIP